MSAAVDNVGKCIRCREVFGEGDKCQECGVHKDRTIVKAKRVKKIGGKRGHNSGKVSQHGTKS